MLASLCAFYAGLSSSRHALLPRERERDSLHLSSQLRADSVCRGPFLDVHWRLLSRTVALHVGINACGHLSASIDGCDTIS